MHKNSSSAFIFIILTAVVALSLAALGCSEIDERCADFKTAEERQACSTCTVYKKVDDRQGCMTQCQSASTSRAILACQGGQILFLKPQEKSTDEALRQCDEFFKTEPDSDLLQKSCRNGVMAEDGRYKNVLKNDPGTAGSDRENGNRCVQGCKAAPTTEDGEGPKRQF